MQVTCYKIEIPKKGKYIDLKIRKFLFDTATDMTIDKYNWRNVLVDETDKCFVLEISGKLCEQKSPSEWQQYENTLRKKVSEIKIKR